MGNGQNNKGEDICCCYRTIEDNSNEQLKSKLFELFNKIKGINELFKEHTIIKLDKLFLINSGNIPDLISIFSEIEEKNLNINNINIENKNIEEDLKKIEIINELEDCKKCKNGFIIVNEKFMELIKIGNEYNNKSIMIDVDKNNNLIMLKDDDTIKFEPSQNSFVYKFIIDNTEIKQYQTRIYPNNNNN